MAGGPSSPAKRSFLDVLHCSNSDLSVPLKQPSQYRGEPALKFTAEEIASLADPLKFALVGKFSHGRPSMAALRQSFRKIDLKGSVQLGLLDHRHILIRVDHDEDFLRFRLRKFWSFDGFTMRVFKWSPEFRTDVESPFVPAWVSFDSLPLFMFNKSSLFSLAKIIGLPLKIDAATTDLSRPSVARVCIEVDLKKDLPKRIWLEIGSLGFWQSIIYEDLPKYCLSCQKVGHSAAECGLVNSKNPMAAPSLQKPQWIRKNKSMDSTVKTVALVSTAHTAATEAPHSAAISLEAKTNSVLASPDPLVEIPSTSASVVVEKQTASAPISAADNDSAPVSVAEIMVEEVAAATPFAVSSMLAEVSHRQPISECLQQPLLPMQTETAAVADAKGVYILNEPVQISALPPSTSAENILPCSTLSAGILDVASARKDKQCDVAEKSYAKVLLGAKQPAEKSNADLNPNAPHFVPKNRFPGTSSSASIKPRFHAIKSAEYPSLPLPNFRIFFSARPQFPQDSLEEPSSPRPSDIFQIFSEGDDVPRLPIQRKKLSVSLRASCQDFNAILKKGRRPEPLSFNRKKWKKLAPYSLTDQTSTSNSSPNNAPHFQEQPTANPNEEVPGDDSSVKYETNWHSSTSEDDCTNDFDYPLASIDPLLALGYEDFSLSPPRRRKYNKRFRDLPPPLPTRRSQPQD